VTKGRHTPPRPGGIGIFWTEALVKTALLAGVAVLLLAGSAQAAEKCVNPDGTQDPVCAEHNDEDWGGEPRQRVTVAPPLPPGPPPLGWVYGPYTMCGDPPRCSMGVVNVPADGVISRQHGRGHGTLVSHSTDVGCISEENVK